MKIFRRNKNKGNRLRIRKMVNATIHKSTPDGWTMRTFAIGGLYSVGFSKKHPNLLLVVSSQGRGIIDCSELEVIERDSDVSGDWINTIELWANGIGIISEEKILVGGIHGGGLPISNENGDAIEYVATEWPIADLIFQPDFKSIYKKGEEKYCFNVFHDYELIAYGFSYNGRYFVIATSSEIHVFKRDK